VRLTGSAFAPAVASSVANSGVPSAAEIQRIQERQSVLLEAHLAGTKEGLKVNDEQARNWPAFESAIRDAARGAPIDGLRAGTVWLKANALRRSNA